MGKDTGNKLAQAVKAGDIEALYTLLDKFDEDEREVKAYQWQLVMRELGHKEAQDDIDTSLQALDDAGEEAIADATFDVATWFLTGENSLDKNLKAAENLLKESKKRKVREIVDIEKILKGLRSKLDDQPLKLLDKYFPKK